ncbi:MAG: hypothetical protein KAG26_08650 [Methylococcales bacterium]|nr:hypothetical protein [Methylococcales bacterium]
MNSENNKLIAKFIGRCGKQNHFLYTFKGVAELTGDTWYYLQDSKFHSSWDWIMPVIQKCYILNNKEGFNPFPDLCEINLNTSYKAVVEFIKSYNYEEKINLGI